MKTADIIGVILIVSVLGLGGYFLLAKKTVAQQQAPQGAARPNVPAIPPQAPNAPPQPTPQATSQTKQTNEYDAGIAGINAGRDVLLGGLKAIWS